jgi:hypothetical protein
VFKKKAFSLIAAEDFALIKWKQLLSIAKPTQNQSVSFKMLL